MTVQEDLIALAFFIFFPPIIRSVFKVRLGGKAAIAFPLFALAAIIDLISRLF